MSAGYYCCNEYAKRIVINPPVHAVSQSCAYRYYPRFPRCRSKIVWNMFCSVFIIPNRFASDCQCLTVFSTSLMICWAICFCSIYSSQESSNSFNFDLIGINIHLFSRMLLHRRKDLALQLITFPKIFEDSSFILYPGLSGCLPVSHLRRVIYFHAVS